MGDMTVCAVKVTLATKMAIVMMLTSVLVVNTFVTRMPSAQTLSVHTRARATPDFRETELPVHINWAVQTIANLTFTIENCNVNHGGESFVLIKNMCYATVINARPLVTGNAQSKAFEYRLFKAKDVKDPNQVISCSINVCDLGIQSGVSGSCNNAPTDSCKCPHTTSGADQDDFYKLSVDGAEFDRAKC